MRLFLVGIIAVVVSGCESRRCVSEYQCADGGHVSVCCVEAKGTFTQCTYETNEQVTFACVDLDGGTDCSGAQDGAVEWCANH